MLEMRGISKAYGKVQANRSIDLTVGRASIVGLLGANGSGKSTLMKCLFGMVKPDAGGIVFKGRELAPGSPREAIRAGIGMIHQHFTLVEAMTVAENVMLGWERTGGWLNTAAVSAEVARASRDFGIDVDPAALIGGLALGERQRVEIVKALVRGCDLLILDEPTSILAPPEVARLLALMRRLRDDGRSVIFISHKLGEVLEVCDEIVVLRDGEVAGNFKAAGATRGDLARIMVGSAVDFSFEKRTETGKAVLTVENLTAEDDSGVPRLKGASFTLHAGEILALAGVDGNGQGELANALAGLAKITGGRIELDGDDITLLSAPERLERGLAYIPADRSSTSLVPGMSVADNLRLRDYARAPFSRHGFLNKKIAEEKAKQAIRHFDIRCPGPSAAAGTLSGGNQQKVVLAREIAREPAVLVAFQPTWGLDPGATRFVIERVLELRARGAAMLYISSELEEVLAVGDRIGVLFDGRLSDLMPRAQADASRIGMALSGAALQAAA
jgi:ABC-type uncharacterized transport system ATPase subunit